MRARPTLMPYGLLLRPGTPTRSPAAARAATALICSQCLIDSCISSSSSLSSPNLPYNIRSYHPSRRKNQSALGSAASAAQNLFSKESPPPPPPPPLSSPSSSSPSPALLSRSPGTSPRLPGTPGGVPVTIDPLRIVAKELKFMKKNIHKLLGSGHPLLDRVAKYYTTSEGKHVRPLLVLLMSQATAHGPKTTRQVPFVSAAGINDGITSPAILSDTNPDQSALLSSTSPSSLEAAYTGLAGNVDANYDADSGNGTDILPAQQRLAEITELIHTASLLHDDVIDNAVTRRSTVSANLAFGNKMAVLAGDFLLGRASVALARLRDPEVIELLSTVIANLIEGEFMQLKNTERDELNPSFTEQTITYYLQKTYLKSASLISKSCRAAALLGHSSPEIVEAAYSYGRNLGLAFQLVDDMLDYTISGDELGKPAGADLELGLATAPLLFAWRANPELGALVGRKFSGEGDVQLARQIVSQSDGLEQTRALAQEYTNKAIQSIRILPDTEAKTGLIEMCAKLTKRRK
ncbi:decaprenyl-diphosphate synthase subunit 1 [Histoplasma capsulatum G186AR]|uniref:Decaprenyl-diphosphate synthase subunit 1 n=2 Tax=Ajellomyces capsulatus TaxID=5037 RepID=C0NXS2_AJECG|nr:decaprenyl-diphosphate synthase subunit 1 [Histoplasma capsulatum G186AR]EEH03590.1 decaprenyl-diphosphate synthase subunit 1 [Histoplasma capsulatum G186AR]KAG5293837.1 decaprenyl-diphosphate synthase subunit 1 [Histoplasma capsulatum]QSS75289.1 decaprenyl-diphosphate synthase subunit 1 [Histoplasma capsulatum G186AR]